jgi:hypothetical protein
MQKKINVLKIYRQKLRELYVYIFLINYNGFNIENITLLPIKLSFIN